MSEKSPTYSQLMSSLGYGEGQHTLPRVSKFMRKHRNKAPYRRIRSLLRKKMLRNERRAAR